VGTGRAYVGTVSSRFAVRAVALVVVTTALACTSGRSSSAPTTTSTAASTTTTTTAPTTTTSAVTPVGSPQEAATDFVTAWRNGDRAAAATIAVPSAVDAVFAAGDPGSIQNRGCNSPPDGSPVLCVYRTGPGELQVRVAPSVVGWYVDQAIVSPA